MFQPSYRQTPDPSELLHWNNEDGDPEVEQSLSVLDDIFTERLVNIILYQGKQILYGTWCKPSEVTSIVETEEATRYELKSWRGNYDREAKMAVSKKV